MDGNEFLAGNGNIDMADVGIDLGKFRPVIAAENRAGRRMHRAVGVPPTPAVRMFPRSQGAGQSF